MADRNPVDVSRTLYRTRKMQQAQFKSDGAAYGRMSAAATAFVGLASYITGNVAMGQVMNRFAGAQNRAVKMLDSEGAAINARGKVIEDLILRGRRLRGTGKQAALSANRVALGQQAAAHAVTEQRSPTVPNAVVVAAHAPHSDRAALGGAGSGNTKRGFQNPNNLKAALLAQGKKAPA